MADSIGAAWSHVVRLARGAKTQRATRKLTIGPQTYELHFQFLTEDERWNLPNFGDRHTLCARAVVRVPARGADLRELHQVAWGIHDQLEVGASLARWRNSVLMPSGPLPVGPMLDMRWAIHRYGQLIDSFQAVFGEDSIPRVNNADT